MIFEEFSELNKLHMAEVSAMMPVVTAAIAVHREWTTAGDFTDAVARSVDDLFAAVIVYLESLKSG